MNLPSVFAGFELMYTKVFRLDEAQQIDFFSIRCMEEIFQQQIPSNISPS